MTKELALALNLLNSYPELAAKISGAGFGRTLFCLLKIQWLLLRFKKLSEYGINLEEFKIAQKITEFNLLKTKKKTKIDLSLYEPDFFLLFLF